MGTEMAKIAILFQFIGGEAVAQKPKKSRIFEKL